MKQSQVIIYMTDNYNQFKYQEGNRELNKSNIKDLKNKIDKNNLLDYHPILVNEFYEVIDGQHRLEVAKDKGLIISYIIVNNTRLRDTININTSGLKWSTSDFLNSYTSKGFCSYKSLKTFMNNYNFMSLSQCVYAIKGKADTKSFKEGSFNFTGHEILIADEVAQKMAEFGVVDERLKKHSFLSRTIRHMIIKGNKWDHTRLIDLCMENRSKLLSMPHSEKSIKLILQDIYNKRLRTKVEFK